jgi:hypothetical protein
MRFLTHIPGDDGKKRCRKCGMRKTLAFFPRDRSQPDGRWHSCRACNRDYWHERGKPLAADRKIREKACRPPSRTGLRGLRQYRRPNGEEFASVPPELRPRARQLFNRYLARHRHHLTPTLIASLHGTAASNVKRLGDRSLARRLRWMKGYYRSLRRQLEAAEEDQNRASRRAGKPRSGSTNMDGI